MSVTPTPEQQAIADYPLRPLRVTAGAGTGKTTTMALRLAALIRREGIAPEEALGITFTNKAAEELADRLRLHLHELAAEGRQVEVTTYHGFAYGLLAEFGSLLGGERGVGVVTPGYARQLLREALGAGPRLALDLTSPGARVDELAGLAGRLGDHLLAPGDLLREGATDGDEVAARRAEMAAALAAYAERKQELGLVDYADLIARGHRLLSGHPEVAERLRARYRVVLLDEYQDTNPAQRELLRLIFGAGFPVTAVGDPDQTIYEWRGASLENFAAFPNHFPEEDGTPAATLTLSYNRRSSSRVVELANLVRARIGRRSDLDRLRPLPDAPPGDLEAAWFHNAVDEAAFIARRLVELHDSGETAWRDIGVLFRRHREIGLVRQALEQQAIPVEVASLGGLLEVPEVADLHAWLSIIGRPDDDASLMRVLLGAHYRLGLGDLAPLAAWRLRPRPPEDEPALRRAMLEAFDHLDECSGLSTEATGRLERFRGTHRRLLEEAQGTSLVELCRRVLDATGAWPEIEALGDAARLSARLNLYRFLDLAEAWSPLEGAPSLDAFLDYLELLAADGAADELDTARVSGEDAVVLLTVHRAKGLEWPVVVLPALCQGTFPGEAHTLEDPLAHPQFLPDHLRLDRDWLPDLPDDAGERKEIVRQRHQDQEWRTAYVAVTRAKRHLVLTGAFWYGGKKPKEPGPLLALAMQAGARQAAAAVDPGLAPETLRLDPGTGDPDPFFPAGWRAALRAAVADPTFPARLAEETGSTANFVAAAARLAGLLKGLPEALPDLAGTAPFRTTVTGLVTFASCPLRFHWSAVDRLPRHPAPQLRHGIELHRRIELHNRGGLPLEEAEEALYDFAAGEGHGSAGDPFAAFRASRFAARPPLLVETPFELAIGETRVAGRIDAVYEDPDGAWEVVDFKSGRLRLDPARRVQLEAYAVALAEAGFTEPAPTRTRVTFAYLGGGRLQEAGEEVTEAWLDDARRHLADLATRAAAGERRATPGESCLDCDFARFCPDGSAWLAAHPG